MENELEELVQGSIVTLLLAQYLLWPLIIYFSPYSAVVITPYIIWMSFDIYMGCTTIEKKSNWLRKMFWWKHLRDYFPVRLIKTADLPEGRSYILAAHHHAILPFSILVNFLTEANYIGKHFPGIDFRVVSRVFLYLPIFREFARSLGCTTASESNIIRLLQRNASTGIVVTPGGSREVPLSRAGSNEFKIYASKRKGFVRVALKTGCALVPVVSFGDTEILEFTRNGPKRLENFVPSIQTTFPDGFRMTSLRLKRFSLNTIVGEPIIVPKVENPSAELVDQYHAQFYDAFRQLFEKYKHDYSPVGSSYELIIV